VRARLSVSPEGYARVAIVALVALAVIVLTGAAVRLSGSGLGCPDWPKCYGRTFAPLETHAVIEYTNRLLSGLVGLTSVAAALLAFLRRPFRRHLALLAVLLPLGVVGQAILGGVTVREHLRPGFVMAHFGLSMLILAAAVALAWRARYDPGARPRATDRLSTWAVRALLPLGALTIFAGTAATAAGPHAGGMAGQRINRLDFRGTRTLDWTIHQHARIAVVMGVASVAVWLLLRRRRAAPQLRRAVTVLVGLLALQGVIGFVQYFTHLPVVLVLVHMLGAVLITVAATRLVWSVRGPASELPLEQAPLPAAASR
jgi:cytochrome c oxidase assembly protein subunit 15